jgi:hypothetical protein
MKMSKDQFGQFAKPLRVLIEETTIHALPKRFSTGSVGWNANAKTQIVVNGEALEIQVGVNLTVIGTKDQSSKNVKGLSKSLAF